MMYVIQASTPTYIMQCHYRRSRDSWYCFLWFQSSQKYR